MHCLKSVGSVNREMTLDLVESLIPRAENRFDGAHAVDLFPLVRACLKNQLGFYSIAHQDEYASPQSLDKNWAELSFFSPPLNSPSRLSYD